MNPFRSIKGKLLILTLCISLIPITIITVVYYLNARRTLKRQTLEGMTAIAESKRLHFLSLLKAKRSRVVDFSSDGFIRDRLDTITREDFHGKSKAVSTLNRHLSVNKKPLDTSIAEIAVLDMEGKVVASTHEAWLGKDLSEQEAFKQAIGEAYGATHVGQPRYSPFLDVNSIFVSAPLTSRNDAEKIGVIVNAYDLSALSEITTDRVGMGETGEVYLVNSDGMMLTESRFIENAVLKEKVDTEPVRRIAAGGSEMTGIYPNYRSVSVVGASAYIPEYTWTLLAEIDKSEAFASLRTLGIVSLVVGLVTAAVAASVGIIFATSTARPVRRLTDATERLAGGDLDYRVKVVHKDELGILANSFNNMAEGLSKEMSQRKKAEKQLEKTVAELQRSNAELQQFANVASHDLQEPLRMVASYVQLLERRYKGKLDADADDFINFAVDGATRMQVLINDLLAYSRVSTRGKYFEPTDSSAVLKQAVANLQVAIEEGGAEVTCDALPTVMADATQLGQVFQNLMGNGIKFCTNEPPRIHVSAEQKGCEWVFSIHDNGIGIDRQYFERIFVMFQRLHSKSEYSGTGIGLTICRRIVERHGGRIWVESEPGKGSTFYFAIPVRR